VLCLDDVHWADRASLDALAALVRRPPAARVLIALAGREGLAAAGEPERGAVVMLEALGRPDLTSVVEAERPAAAADLVEVLLACSRSADAERVLTTGQTAAARADTDWAAITAGRARAAVLLANGQGRAAAETAAEAVRAARTPAPLSAARAQLLHGRALAAAGDRPSAITALIAAESMLERFGAARWRDEAVRELRVLGHRVRRPARDQTSWSRAADRA